MNRRLARLLLATSLVPALLAVPPSVALACSCGFPGYAEAIDGADAAFVGTVIAEDEPTAGTEPGDFPEATYLFDVGAAKDEMADPFAVVVLFGGGASCGFDMNVGEEWLVIASVDRGAVRTNLCHGTIPVPDLDPESAGIVASALAFPGASEASVPSAAAVPATSPEPTAASQPSESPTTPAADLVPVGAVGAVGLAALIALGLVAWRRSHARTRDTGVR